MVTQGVHRMGRLVLEGTALVLMLAAVPAGQRPEPVDTAIAPSPAGPQAPPIAKPELTPEVRQAGADGSWWRAASAQIEKMEYGANPTDQGLLASNRAHNLQTTFGERGIEVLPQTQKNVAPPWRFAWETSAFGRTGCMAEVAPVTPGSNGDRITYLRDGWSEWYENTAKGLEQGFTIERRPAGEGPLRIAGEVPAHLKPELREDGAIDFLTSQGACALRYGELHTWDAQGEELPSELVVAGNELAIVIDDRNAEYPVFVDPLMTSPAWTAEGNEVFANFGVTVATAGDVNGDGFSDVLVGSLFLNGQAGWAFVYHGSAAGLATTSAWSAHSNQATSSLALGTAGDVNGDGFADVIAGIADYDNGQVNEGKIFVYLGSATGLGASPAWTAESNQASAEFGSSVGTAGDVNGDGFGDVIVGAQFYDNGELNEGGAFVYHGSAAGLGPTPAWIGESNRSPGYMGASASTAGDVNGDGYADVIVGAPMYSNGEGGEGRAFAYLGSASGLAASPAWTAESNQVAAGLGKSVSTAGDVNGDGYGDVIVGAIDYDNGENNEGRVYAYLGSASGLGSSSAWIGEPNQAGAHYGSSVGTAGDVNGDGFSDVIVGAWSYSNGPAAEGWAFVYQGAATGLANAPSWTGEGNQLGANFANSVGTAGDVNGDGYSDVIVGAYNYDNGQEDEGRAFVYLGAGDGLATSAGWFAESNAPIAAFGWTMATAGDVNGDGFSDVIVGAPDYGTPPNLAQGLAAVFLGSPAGLSVSPDWLVMGGNPGATFGFSVATAGDVNGDGFSDIIVGSLNYDGDLDREGRALVYHGSASGLATSPAWTAEGNQAIAGYGYSVATAGDVNGDGFSDVIVGAIAYENGLDDEGRAFVYHGSEAGLAATPGWTAESNQAFAYFGFSVATAGDVNRDGFSDVIVGAPSYDNGEDYEGKAFVYLGSPAGLATSPNWAGESNFANATFGVSVATAGDVNGDGFSDVIIGASGYSETMGSAYVYGGFAGGVDPTRIWIHAGNQNGMLFGTSVATAGDVNGDGFSDVIVGADGYNNDLADEGRAFVFHGSAAGPASSPAWIAEGNGFLARFGTSVATAGDVNGDGFSDIVVGAPDFSNGQNGEGRAFLYYGNKGDGPHRIARQVRTDDSAPIWPFLNSDSESRFRLKALGRTAAGRGDVQLQFEVKPAGTPFDGTGLVTSSVANTGVPSAEGSAVPFSELANGLTPETLYHWRLRVISDSPFFPRTPWMSLPYNNVTEADVRTGEAITAVDDDEAPSSVAGLWLAPASPNPFNPRTTISFLLPARTPVRLAIHDVQGRLVRVLVDGVMAAGSHSLEWNGRDGEGHALATGVYLCRLEAGSEARSRKLTLVK